MSRLEPSAWDPLYVLAGHLRWSFIHPVREKVLEALCVLQDLCGLPHAMEDDWAVDAFAYALVEALTREAGMREARRVRLLQIVVANLYYSSQASASLNPQFFWTFFNELSNKYRSAEGESPARATLLGLLRGFLAHYGLAGPENQDVIGGIYRLILPLVQEAGALLKAKAHLLDAGPAFGEGRG